MASDSNKFTVKFFTFLLFTSQVSLAYSSRSLLTDGKVTQHAVKGLFRNRRQMCPDGTYDYEGRTCCLCGAGLRLESHCSVKPSDGQCELCDPGTYSSDPNSQMFCEPCTSCEHPNANLEVVEPCTSARNTKCGCKKGHYCDTETCTLCHPCQECGTEGVKVACTGTNNTICNDIAQGGNDAIIGGVIALIFLLILAGLLSFYFCRRRRRRFSPSQESAAQTNGTATEMVLLPVKVSDLHRHLHDVAGILGWKDMNEVAIRTEIPKTVIENCQLNHPGNAGDQTVELLDIFCEKHGRTAASTLIDALQKSGKKDKEEKVTELLRRDDNAA
ncbi:tumor necrosis factor receptor superfamily member 26 [Solea solea]|uniref:tumor necrosis factor receptor superfamily member 26 n=1 Tax=Solea solea TaxID=90069 RepID=UPI00272991A4|nr:tumor necrosis factor receptor superfamily member 26 [Solea solea]